jgi:acetylornithine deacetylase/succinyl-diaminopimelate desuccinylase-like protein
LDNVIKYLRDRRPEHLEWTRELCRIPSISTRPEHKADVRESVEWTHQLCQRIGLNSRIEETGGHPLVYAECCNAPGRPTLLVYGHVDVQPTGERALWDADPFDPVVKNGWLICRGSADDKGQVLMHLRAAAAWLATEKRLPVNLKFLIEGEEEVGSPNLAPFVQQHADLLACDQVIISDTGLYEDGWPTVTVGTRGLVYREILLTGPKQDLHSGTHGGAIANPAVVLSEIIASLHDKNGKVTVPGFYADVEKPTAKRRREIASLPFSERKYLKELGAPRPYGEKGFSTQERRSIRPTLEVNGMTSGFQGEGANTIIPARASAKVSMRLVAKQNALKIGKAFEKAIKQRCPETVKLTMLRHGQDVDAYLAPTDSPYMQAALQALGASFRKTPVLMFEGGSLPILPMFKKALKADSLLLGFASPRCNAHGPNEKARIDDLDRGTEAIARFLGGASA